MLYAYEPPSQIPPTCLLTDAFPGLLGAKTLSPDPKIYVSQPYKQNDANPELEYSGRSI